MKTISGKRKRSIGALFSAVTLIVAMSLPSGCRTQGDARIPMTTNRFTFIPVGVTNTVYVEPGPGVKYGVVTDNVGLLYLQGLTPEED